MVARGTRGALRIFREGKPLCMLLQYVKTYATQINTKTKLRKKKKGGGYLKTSEPSTPEATERATW